jgi:hypothetical protein
LFVVFCVAVESCLFPGKPAYGSIVQSADTFPVGSLVNFRCNRPGYQLSGRVY